MLMYDYIIEGEEAYNVTTTRYHTYCISFKTANQCSIYI